MALFGGVCEFYRPTPYPPVCRAKKEIRQLSFQPCNKYKQRHALILPWEILVIAGLMEWIILFESP
jgi:hypothetical protein